jgi:hypothetical protein
VTRHNAGPMLASALLALALLWCFWLAVMAPPRPGRPARPAGAPWTPSSGPCEGLSPLECKWN